METETVSPRKRVLTEINELRKKKSNIGNELEILYSSFEEEIIRRLDKERLELLKCVPSQLWESYGCPYPLLKKAADTTFTHTRKLFEQENIEDFNFDVMKWFEFENDRLQGLIEFQVSPEEAEKEGGFHNFISPEEISVIFEKEEEQEEDTTIKDNRYIDVKEFVLDLNEYFF